MAHKDYVSDGLPCAPEHVGDCVSDAWIERRCRAENMAAEVVRACDLSRLRGVSAGVGVPPIVEEVDSLVAVDVVLKSIKKALRGHPGSDWMNAMVLHLVKRLLARMAQSASVAAALLFWIFLMKIFASADSWRSYPQLRSRQSPASRLLPSCPWKPSLSPVARTLSSTSRSV